MFVLHHVMLYHMEYIKEYHMLFFHCGLSSFLTLNPNLDFTSHAALWHICNITSKCIIWNSFFQFSVEACSEHQKLVFKTTVKAFLSFERIKLKSIKLRSTSQRYMCDQQSAYLKKKNNAGLQPCDYHLYCQNNHQTWT